jgi:hypothetical protein
MHFVVDAGNNKLILSCINTLAAAEYSFTSISIRYSSMTVVCSLMFEFRDGFSSGY